MPRLLVALATLCACGAVAAAFKTCSPTFDPADVLNLFYANKGARTVVLFPAPR